MPNNEKKEIKEKILSLYEKIQKEQEVSNNVKNEEKQELKGITYYKELQLVNLKDGTGIAENEVFVARMKNEKDEDIYSIYDIDNQKIADVDQSGKINFTQKYIDLITERFNDTVDINKENIGNNNFKLPEELGEEDIYSTKEELEESKKLEKDDKSQSGKKENEGKNKDEEKKDEQATDNNKKDMDKIAEQSGIQVSNINSITSIKPEEKVTDIKTFEQMINKEGIYSNFYIADIGGKYTVFGKNKDGKFEKIDELQLRNGTNYRETTQINEDESVEMSNKKAVLTIDSGKEGISVEIGQYGITQINYAVKSKESNEFITGPILNSSITYNKPTQKVKEEMRKISGDNNNAEEMIDNAKHETHERESGKVDVSDVNANPYDDKIPNSNEVIEIHDKNGNKIMDTTIAKQAEFYDMSIEEYGEYYTKADGDCASEKILNANTMIENERNEENEHQFPERPTEHKL